MSSNGTAVVTGAGQGIGRAIAERLISDGYDVLALDIAAGPLEEVRESLGCRTAIVDVTDSGVVASVAAQAPNCQVLVNNAAIQRYQDLLHTTQGEMRAILNVNVIGPVLMAQALVPLMANNGGGVVINISSITSRAHAAGTSLYPASKAAVNQLTQAMAVEFAPFGVRCNAVGPGTVLTEGTAGHYGDEGARAAIAGVLPVSRMGAPEDIANAVSFLCSPDASWITGQTLFVDGGFTAAQGSFFRTARKAQI
jgi:3-oxoacyl-[acyl-carrier protein] reductase